MNNEGHEDETGELIDRQGHLDAIVSEAMIRVAESLAGRQPATIAHFFFGSLAVDPRNLSLWYIFDTNADQHEATKSGLTTEIEAKVKSQLLATGYPTNSVPDIKVWFSYIRTTRVLSGKPYQMTQHAYQESLRETDVRQKDLTEIVSAATARTNKSFVSRQPAIKSHQFYGAWGIHPRNLVIWYIFDTEADLLMATESGLSVEIESKTKSELGFAGYPKLPFVQVAFASTEDIQRKAGGNFWVYVK